MKIAGPIFYALVLAAWPIWGQAQTRSDCGQAPLLCIAEAMSYVEDRGASESYMVDLRTDYARALARAGDLGAASEIAAQLDGARHIVPAQLALAEAFGRAGQDDAAQAAITMALEATNDTPYPSLRLDLLADIAAEQFSLGDTAGAGETLAPVMAEIEVMPADFRRDARIVRVINSGVLFQDMAAAQALIHRIDRPYKRRESITKIALFFANGGEAALALEEVLKIENPELRVEAVVILSLALSDLGEVDMAREAAQHALRGAIRGGSPAARAFAMVRTVKALAKLGDKTAAASLLARAMVEARNAMGRASYVRFMIELTSAYRLSGEEGAVNEALEVALRTAQGIEDDNTRDVYLVEVVAAFARFGKMERAFEIIWMHPNADIQAFMLTMLALELN